MRPHSPLHLGLAAFALLCSLAACGDDDSGAAPLDPNPPLVLGAGEQRPAEVVLPADYDITRTYPLVILLHGYGANANAQDFIFGLAARTTRDQFILVLPNGTLNANGERFWNGTQECCQFGETAVDDVAYLASLMHEAMRTYAVDPDRIRLAGHSNGGYMSYRYACEQPVPVDRIAVLAGSTFLDPADCRRPRPIDVLHMHGTNDDTIRYEPFDGPGVRTVGAEAAIGWWAAEAGCADTPELVERRDHHRVVRVGNEPAETEVLRYPGCGGETIELWKAVNGDHLYLSVNDRWRDEVAAFLSE
jgi:polyhydroxybutyrate depolymerase